MKKLYNFLDLISWMFAFGAMLVGIIVLSVAVATVGTPEPELQRRIESLGWSCGGLVLVAVCCDILKRELRRRDKDLG